MTAETTAQGSAQHAPFLEAVGDEMAREIARWPWAGLAPLKDIVTAQVRRNGKRLRPRLTLAVAQGYGGDPDQVVAPAAAVEFYHVASLVLDDVQDNSVIRSGAETVHTTSGVSTAINAASTLRSMAYHPIHRNRVLSAGLKLRLHQELDEAATRLIMGQSIDIGWNRGWYASYRDFPYERMVEGKTGALFGCAAAMGALTAGAPEDGVRAARVTGTTFGVVYQMIDDYLDVFGSDDRLRPRLEDVRGGKLSLPVLWLLRTLSAEGRGDEAERLQRLCTAGNGTSSSQLVDALAEYGVLGRLGTELHARVASLRADLPSGSGIHQLVGGLSRLVRRHPENGVAGPPAARNG